MWSQASSTNEHVREYFSKAVEKGRVSHAYLLAGPAGSGKTGLCSDFARSLFCEAGAQPGGQCAQCRSIEHLFGKHPFLCSQVAPVDKLDHGAGAGVELNWKCDDLECQHHCVEQNTQIHQLWCVEEET